MRQLTEQELAQLPEFYQSKYQHWLKTPNDRLTQELDSVLGIFIDDFNQENSDANS